MLSGFQDDTRAKAPDYSSLAQVRAYWEGVRNGARVPARNRIDPRGIEGALAQSFLLERIAPGMARFRVAGMQLAEVMGTDARGMPLSTMVEPAARAGFGRALERVFADPAVLEMDLEAERGIGRPALSARLIVLPLTDDAGLVRLGLGCLALTGAIGRGPRRFFAVRQTIRPLDGDRDLRLADLAGDLMPAPRPPRALPGRTHLRLVGADA